MEMRQRMEFREGARLTRKHLMAGAGLIVLAIFAVGIALFVRAVEEDSLPIANLVDVPTKIGLLFQAQDPSRIVNDIVFFNNVQLEPGPSDNLYYAVGASGTRVLVLVNSSKPLPDDNAVNLKGTVRRLPSTYVLSKKWKLTKDELQAANEQGIYIEAEKITPRKTISSRMARK